MTYLTADDFDYELPNHLIAQAPLATRTASRMCSVLRQTQQIQHESFTDLLNRLKPNDCLILNDTRVFPARLFGQKQTGGKIECLIERLLDDHRVLAHIKSSKSPKVGAKLIFEEHYQATVQGRQGALFELEFDIDQPLLSILEQAGRLPLPPYITRDPDQQDYQRYQTVFGEQVGAVAAPTAGLHFDEATLEAIKDKGVTVAKVTLHVGAGTFQPVRVDNIKDHQMHAEWIDVSAATVKVIESCRARQGRVFAVGTTVLRALEAASQTGQLQPYCGDTDIFIYPGFQFHCVDALLTNFHLPKSTLLMLVSALASKELIFEAYSQAIERQYRFFSYGDCMLIL